MMTSIGALLPDETVYWDGRLSIYAELRHIILGLVFFIWALVASHWLSVILLALGIIMWTKALIRYATTHLVITNQRVVLRRGLIHIRISELLLYKVDSVYVDQNFLGRLFDFGDIRISASNTHDEILYDIAEPNQVRQELLKAADRMRRSFRAGLL